MGRFSCLELFIDLGRKIFNLKKDRTSPVARELAPAGTVRRFGRSGPEILRSLRNRAGASSLARKAMFGN